MNIQIPEKYGRCDVLTISGAKCIKRQAIEFQTLQSYLVICRPHCPAWSQFVCREQFCLLPLINFPAQHSLWPTCARTTRSFSLLLACDMEVNSIFRGLQTGSVNVAHAPYLPVGSNSTFGDWEGKILCRCVEEWVNSYTYNYGISKCMGMFNQNGTHCGLLSLEFVVRQSIVSYCDPCRLRLSVHSLYEVQTHKNISPVDFMKCLGFEADWISPIQA